MSHTTTRIASLVLAIAMALLLPAGARAAEPTGDTRVKLAGRVFAGGSAMHPATVTVYCAGDTPGFGAVALASIANEPSGRFRVEFVAPSDPDAVVYIIAESPTTDITLATIAGSGDLPKAVTINERTTIATAWTMAQFIDGDVIGGNAIGVRNAALIFNNLIDPKNGRIGKFLRTKPNGVHTSTMGKLNSLANMVATCAASPDLCQTFFSLATPPGGESPTNTLEAAISIAHNPGHNASLLWWFSRNSSVFRPDAPMAPPDWTLALKYVGNGRQFSGPGACAFDDQGNAWINNNYTPRRNRFLKACGSHLVTKFSPDGKNLDGSPFTGGGVDGAGFGISVDPFGDVWVANFGFYGSTCPEHLRPAANSVSQFLPDGTPVSPNITGYTQGNISSPQAIVPDQAGNIWIANSCNGTVTQYIAGNPNEFWNYTVDAGMCADGDVPRPFGIAIDDDGNGWITDNKSNSVFQLDADGNLINGPICGEDTGFDAPLGIAIDSLGNLWVANSSIVHVPCPDDEFESPEYGNLIPTPAGASVTQINPDGTIADVHTNPSIFIPWGIAVDGDDHIWVANFGGHHVAKLCGANPATIPDGKSTGDALTPLGGFYFDGLVRVTGLSIDPSGNVWLANNWLEIPIQTNPGGDGMVVFIGIAAPVLTPLIGPVQQP